MRSPVSSGCRPRRSAAGSTRWHSVTGCPLASSSGSPWASTPTTRPSEPLVDRTMIMRIWQSAIDESEAAEYERFAHDVSRPMFEAHEGFRGLLFGRDGSRVAVVTLWEDDAAADAFERSTLYRETVARIESAGFLSGPSTTDRF